MLNGSQSSNAGGPIAIYQWLRAGQPIATSAEATVRLPDGNNLITLLIFDDRGNSAAASVRIFVGRPEDLTTLSQLPGLTPNQQSMGQGLDQLCPRLRDTQASLVGDQFDLLEHCRGLSDSSTDEQVAALDEITPDELNSISSQTFDLSRQQLINVTDRLIALRAGAAGFNLTGLTLESEGASVPVDSLELPASRRCWAAAQVRIVRATGQWPTSVSVYGCAGNYGTGRKDAGVADRGFHMDGWGVMGGIDYRLAPTKIVGLAIGYGQGSTTFNPIGSGSLDTSVATGALYATMYNERGFYFDAIASYLQADYDSVRRMFFTERSSLVDLVASGTTDGTTMSAALSIGLDQHFHGFTFASNFGAHYIRSTVDAFREHGADGLDLAYDEQNYATAGVSAGLRFSYSWKKRTSAR